MHCICAPSNGGRYCIRAALKRGRYWARTLLRGGTYFEIHPYDARDIWGSSWAKFYVFLILVILLILILNNKKSVHDIGNLGNTGNLGNHGNLGNLVINPLFHSAHFFTWPTISFSNFLTQTTFYSFSYSPLFHSSHFLLCHFSFCHCLSLFYSAPHFCSAHFLTRSTFSSIHFFTLPTISLCPLFHSPKTLKRWFFLGMEVVSSGDKILGKASLAQEKKFFQATPKQKGGGLVQICWHFCPQTIAAQIIESVESKFMSILFFNFQQSRTAQ